MTDIAVETFHYTPPDRSWLLFEADSHYGSAPTTQAVIDFSTFDPEDDYPDGYLPSGMALSWNSDSSKVVKVGSTGAGGAAGLLYNATDVPSNSATKVVVAVLDSFAIVTSAKLPSNSGVTSAVKTGLPLIKFRA